MRSLFALVLCLALLTAGEARAAYLTIEQEVRKEERFRKQGVIFPVLNQSGRNIAQIFGWVYGYDEKRPYKFKLVANPHKPAIRITPGPHITGKTALYWFEVPAYHLKMKKFGVWVYDASVSFER